MHTTIRDNYEPKIGDYYNQIIHDTVNKKIWLFDCDGVFLNVSRTWIKVRDELGDSEFDTVSQAFITHLVEEMKNNLAAEAEARQNADTELTERIDEIEASSDVKDVVGIHEDLDAYPTATLGDNDIIKVLKDETMDDATTYWRWNKAEGEFTLVGQLGPFLEGNGLKTINGESIIGEGNIEIQGGGGYVATANVIYYPNWEGLYSNEWGSNVIIHSIDQEKFAAFVKEHNLRDNISFNYQEEWDPETGPTGKYVWQCSGMGSRIIIDDMSAIGIDLEFENPDETWAGFSVRYTITVDKGETTGAIFNLTEEDLLEFTKSDQSYVIHLTDDQGVAREIPIRTIYQVSLSTIGSKPAPACPNNLFNNYPNLTYASVPFTEIADYFCQGSGQEDNGVSVSCYNAKKIGNYFCNSAKVRSISLQAVEVGDNFMSNAEYTDTWFPTFNNLKKAGHSFFSDTNVAGELSGNYFPVLEEVGDSAFARTKTFPTFQKLKKAGNQFCQGAKLSISLSSDLNALETVGTEFMSNCTITYMINSLQNLTSIGVGFLNNSYVQGGIIFQKLTLTGTWPYNTLSGLSGQLSLTVPDFYVFNTTNVFENNSARIELHGNNGVGLMQNIRSRGDSNIQWKDMLPPEGVAKYSDYVTNENWQTELWKLPAGFYDGGTVSLDGAGVPNMNVFQIQVIPLVSYSYDDRIYSKDQDAVLVAYGMNINYPYGSVVKAARVNQGVLQGEWQDLGGGSEIDAYTKAEIDAKLNKQLIGRPEFTPTGGDGVSFLYDATNLSDGSAPRREATLPKATDSYAGVLTGADHKKFNAAASQTETNTQDITDIKGDVTELESTKLGIDNVFGGTGVTISKEGEGESATLTISAVGGGGGVATITNEDWSALWQ